MANERRYSGSESEEIFKRASNETPDSAMDSNDERLTLSELQAIGAEVGISPDRIAEAANSLDRHGARGDRLKVVGIPIGVQKSFNLPRAPTDHEWGMLVGELRRIFGAEGVESSTGVLREWRNGNLYATVEPTAEGFHLRLGTRKGQVRFLTPIAVGWGIMGLIAAAGGDVVGSVMSLSLAVLFLTPLLRLPRWAALRENQIESIGQNVVQRLNEGPLSADPSS